MCPLVLIILFVMPRKLDTSNVAKHVPQAGGGIRWDKEPGVPHIYQVMMLGLAYGGSFWDGQLVDAAGLSHLIHR